MRSTLVLSLLLLSGVAARGATYHVDPSKAGDPAADGSLEHPFGSWDAVKIAEGNTYLQRRGTVDRPGWIELKAGVTIGAYGEGPLPKIESRAESPKSAVSGWRSHGATIQDLEIVAPKAVSLVNFGSADRVTVARCRLHGANWGIRLTGGSEGQRILDCEVFDILDDGLFIQAARKLEIARCHVHHVNRNWKDPYTSQKEAAGDAIQLAACDAWHVHHNVLDRTNSGNKFCFIAFTAKDQVDKSGIFEHNVLRGPLTTGDGGASIYFSPGDSLVVRYNIIEGPTPGGIYHHSQNLQVYGNLFVGCPVGVTNYGSDPPTVVRNNVFLGVGQQTKGHHYHAESNLNVTPAAGQGASTLEVRLGELQVRPKAEGAAYADGFTGTLAVSAKGIRAAVVDGKERGTAADAGLSGELSLKGGKVVGGKLEVAGAGGKMLALEVAAEGFGLERLLAAQVTRVSFAGPSLAGVDLEPWRKGIPLGAWLLLDLDGKAARLHVTSGAP